MQYNGNDNISELETYQQYSYNTLGLFEKKKKTQKSVTSVRNCWKQSGKQISSRNEITTTEAS